MTDINWRRASWLLGSAYFWFYGANGTWVPFATLYYKKLGFNGWEIALLTALPAIWATVTGPFWGSFADSLNAHRAILRLTPILAALTAFAMTLSTSFWPVFLALAGYSLVTVPMPSFLDSYALTGQDRGGLSFGFLRTFGSVGFATVVLIMGWLMHGEVSSGNLLSLAGAMLIFGAAVLPVPAMPKRPIGRLTDGLAFVLRNREYIVLLVVAYLLACAYMMINMYFAVHVESIGGSTGLTGAAFSISALTELPFIGLGGYWIRRLGMRRMILLCAGLYIVRFALLGFIATPTVAILTSLLHGPSYGGFLVASITLAHRLVGGAYAATAQAVLATMSYGFGAITGALVGGAVINVDTTLIFRGAAVVSLVAVALWIVGTRRDDRTAVAEP